MWQDIQTLMELVSDDPGAEDALMAEAAATLERLQAVLDEWELGSMLNGRFDGNGCVLSIQAGAGGVGAMDSPEMSICMCVCVCVYIYIYIYIYI